MKNLTKLWNVALVTFMAVGIVGCGNSNDSAREIFQGQAIELEVNQVRCEAGPPTGALPGYDGISSGSLSCGITLRTNGSHLGSYVNILVWDAASAFNQQGTWLYHLGGVVSMDLQMDNIPIPIIDGQVLFDSFGTQTGNQICAVWHIFAADRELEGEFCEKVYLGY